MATAFKTQGLVPGFCSVTANSRVGDAFGGGIGLGCGLAAGLGLGLAAAVTVGLGVGLSATGEVVAWAGDWPHAVTIKISAISSRLISEVTSP
jgi:hypothetical protein